MKLSAVVLSLTLASVSFAAPLDTKDREVLLTELTRSSKQFMDAVSGLSPAQWTYKAGPDRWSIAEVAEHIVNSEPFIGNMMMGLIKSSPADPAKAAARAATAAKADEGFLAQLRDRSQKAQAPGEIAPKGGIYKTPTEAIAAFQAARAKTVEFVRTTQEPLREHFFSPFPGSELDGVQGLLMIAGHNERHVLQMLEVKQSPAYPAK